MTADIILSEAEIQALTGYESATKQLQVLRARGFARAFINRLGSVVLERTHYEAVSRGEAAESGKPRKAADLTFLNRA